MLLQNSHCHKRRSRLTMLTYQHSLLLRGITLRTCIFRFALLICSLSLNACTVIAIADAAVSTTVKVGSAVVGTAIDVTKAGVDVITGSSK